MFCCCNSPCTMINSADSALAPSSNSKGMSGDKREIWTWKKCDQQAYKWENLKYLESGTGPYWVSETSSRCLVIDWYCRHFLVFRFTQSFAWLPHSQSPCLCILLHFEQIYNHIWIDSCSLMCLRRSPRLDYNHALVTFVFHSRLERVIFWLIITTLILRLF